MKRNLNELTKKYTDMVGEEMEVSSNQLNDFSMENISDVDDVSVYFKNIENEIVKKISEADVIVGCVAWLTSEPILEELCKKDGASIIVQKEDFLRPDSGQVQANKTLLQRLYNSVNEVIFNYDFYSEGGCALGVQQKGRLMYSERDASRHYFGFRCIGQMKSEDEYTLPRMHHKFLVFCRRIDETKSAESSNLKPYAVWTGSYNMTANATHSLENGMYIKSERLSQQYFQEWKELIMVSEPLDWESEYCAPDLEFCVPTIMS
ncbi:phospholipase D-like domain-containing protein [Vibrio cionasavignyae]|uniref:phospholipase D-like domain-containing protein n=1 Tax=Vibrio cionasavignyae TaxID=2910252 RepID=UPI003D143A30